MHWQVSGKPKAQRHCGKYCDVLAGWFRQQPALAVSVPICHRGNLPRCCTRSHVPTNRHVDQSSTYQLELRLSSSHTELFQPIIIDDLFNPEEEDPSERAVLWSPLFERWEASRTLPLCVPADTHNTHAHTHAHTHPCDTRLLHDGRVGPDISSFGSV